MLVMYPDPGQLVLRSLWAGCSKARLDFHELVGNSGLRSTEYEDHSVKSLWSWVCCAKACFPFQVAKNLNESGIYIPRS